ncbi:MAG: DNA polymerase III subunit chi [Hyphomicrobiaceae bacterium]
MGKDASGTDAETPAEAGNPEVWFYHLERQRLEDVLPNLLDKTRQRGWRAVVQTGSEERRDALNDLLWTFSEASFLAHGTAHDGSSEMQPIYLTCVPENPNGAEVQFLVDEADADDPAGYARSIFLFDGHDEQAVADARTAWKSARDAGCDVTYWQQSVQGKWEKKT